MKTRSHGEEVTTSRSETAYPLWFSDEIRQTVDQLLLCSTQTTKAAGLADTKGAAVGFDESAEASELG